MNYWPKHSKFTDFWKSAKFRKCLKKCAICTKEWSKTETVYVHFMYSDNNKEMYFCDNCEKELTE